jgi:hypothetical protein
VGEAEADNDGIVRDGQRPRVISSVRSHHLKKVDPTLVSNSYNTSTPKTYGICNIGLLCCKLWSDLIYSRPLDSSTRPRFLSKRRQSCILVRSCIITLSKAWGLLNIKKRRAIRHACNAGDIASNASRRPSASTLYPWLSLASGCSADGFLGFVLMCCTC